MPISFGGKYYESYLGLVLNSVKAGEGQPEYKEGEVIPPAEDGVDPLRWGLNEAGPEVEDNGLDAVAEEWGAYKAKNRDDNVRQIADKQGRGSDINGPYPQVLRQNEVDDDTHNEFMQRWSKGGEYKPLDGKEPGVFMQDFPGYDGMLEKGGKHMWLAPKEEEDDGPKIEVRNNPLFQLVGAKRPEILDPQAALPKLVSPDGQRRAGGSFRLPYFGKDVKILQNPSPGAVKGFLNRTKYKAARRLVDKQTGDVYIWDANDPALHKLVADELGIDIKEADADIIGID